MNEKSTGKIIDRYENFRRKCMSLCDRFGLQNGKIIQNIFFKPNNQNHIT